jgi:hypothetical protein
MSILDTKFQYYPSSVYVTAPLGTLTLKDMLNGIKNPKENIKEVFNKIHKATEDGDLELKNKLKAEHLFYFTPSIVTDNKGRKYENITEFNELMVVEFDKINFAEELKQYLFENFKPIVAAFLSPSGNGCKFIVRIPKPKDVEEYKTYFCGLAYHLDKIEGFDVANYNPLLPLYLSWDPDILIRDNPSKWIRKGEKINSFKPVDISVTLEKKNITVNQNDTEFIKRKIIKMISKIIDNGHPQLVSSCVVTGGYIAGGYISEMEAYSLIENLIDQNSYLGKDPRGYKKTALKFIKDGQRSPLYL